MKTEEGREDKKKEEGSIEYKKREDESHETSEERRQEIWSYEEWGEEVREGEICLICDSKITVIETCKLRITVGLQWMDIYR